MALSGCRLWPPFAVEDEDEDEEDVDEAADEEKESRDRSVFTGRKRSKNA